MAQSHLRQVKAARQKLRAAERALHEAIAAAHASGESLRDIATWADYSHQRVHEIVRLHERQQGESGPA